MEDAGEIRLITPSWGAPSNVHAFSTTRAGGRSAPPMDGLNLGLQVGDREADVIENRRQVAVAARLPSEPVWLRQTHGTRVVDVTRVGGMVLDADGSTTMTPGRVLAVVTADCLPVVLTNAAGTRIAVAHAGWRGLVAGILANAVAAFDADTGCARDRGDKGDKGDTLHAWLGPAIGPSSFEVGEEVRDAFVRRAARHAGAFRAGSHRGKYLADIYALARAEIERAALHRPVEITGGDRCTVTEPVTFFSYRRDGVRSGRMATLAWIAQP